MASDEVGAAVEARKQYNQLKGNKPRKPCAILRQVAGREVGRYCVCLHHNVGYAGQNYEETLTQKTTFASFLGLLSRTNR